MKDLKDNQVLTKRTSNGLLPVVEHIGKRDALIRGGYMTEEMLKLSPVDNGFGITKDEYGNHVTFSEDYYGPGWYRITRYIEPIDVSSPDEKDFRGRSIDQVDIDEMLKRFNAA